jgi:hypothetical protein
MHSRERLVSPLHAPSDDDWMKGGSIVPPRGVKSLKRKRQYKKVLSSIKREGRYRGRQKEVAARIVNKTRRKKGEARKSRKK